MAETCAFFLPHKKRQCRLAPVPGKPYCSSHYVVIDGHRKRVCPYNSHHVILEPNYDRHVRKCPDAHVETAAWEEHDVNTGSDDEGPVRTPTAAEERQRTLQEGEANAECETDVPAPPVKVRREASTLSQVPDEATRDALLARVYAALGGGWDEGTTATPPDACHSPTGERQAVQLAALVALIGSLAPPPSLRPLFCEFGCGKASLSAALRAHLGEGSSHILLDRSRFRHTCDRAVRHDEGAWVRVCCDVRHVRLSALPHAAESSLVVLTKHLCGNATDLALRACRQEPRPSSLVLALCCHHRCDWASYPNKPYLRSVGIDEAAFAFLTRMSSWAVCAHADPERVRAGRACKRLLDQGRCFYLEELGYTATLVTYVDSATTPENIALTATWRRPPAQ